MAKSTPPPSSSSAKKGGKRRRTGGASASASSSSEKKKTKLGSAAAATTKGSAGATRSKKKGGKAEEESDGMLLDDKHSNSSSEEEEYDPKPRPRRRKKLDISYEDASSFDDDDSSYSEDDNAKEEEKDEDDSYKSISNASSSSSSSPHNNNNTQRNRSYSPSTILNARVKIISGQYKGKKGTVIDVNRGWYTLDKHSGVPSAVRARELQVTRYATATTSSNAATTTKQEEKGEEEEEQADDNDVQFVNNGYEVSSTTHGDLTGATVRINSGKFEGLQGMINERRSFMHVKIDVDPPMDPLHVSDVTIIQHPNKNAYMEDDIFLPSSTSAATTETVEPNTDEEKLDMLSKKYIGSKIKVLSHHVNAGTIGTVKQVLVGDWYITNNPLISNAYRVDKFDILEYPRGYVKPRIEGGTDKKDDKEEEEEGEEDGSVKEEEEEEDVKKKPAAVGKSNQDEKDYEDEDINEDEEAADETNNRVGTPPPLAAAGDATSPEVPLTPTGRQSLLGARIRINRGRYQGLEGTVTEKRTIRCLEIDTLPHNPFRFEDVNVLEYADNSSLLQESSTSCSDGNNNNGGPPDVFAQHYQRYMGATVKVNENFDLPEYAGTVGKVMKVFVLGDWYITDNPDIPNAFQETKFDILSYPPGYVFEEEGEGGEETRSRDDDEDEMNEDKPTASKEKGGEAVEDEEKDNGEDWGDQTGGDFDPDSSKVDDQKMDGKKEEEGEGEVKQNPLHGATIYVYYGPMKGSMGKLLMAEARGWWIVEGFERKVQSSNCKIVDDGNADIEKIKKHYSDMYKGKRSYSTPHIIQPESLIEGEKGGLASEKEDAGDAVDAGMNMDVEDEHGSYKRKVSGTDFTGKDHNKRMKELGVIYHQQEGGGSNSMFGSRKRAGQHRPKVRDNTPMLNPVLLQSSVEQKKEGDDDEHQLHVQLLPTSLRHLPPDTKIEIFNRRTGKIMKGKDAISMKNLPRELLEHAEYEPIIPPLSGESSITSRMGRSGSNVRINRNVIPQSRVWASKHEGRQVMVTAGEYRGLTGTVDSCIPGGWYCISGLFNKDSNNVVINSNNLELIPETEKAAASNTTSASSKDLENAKIRLHLRAAKLRLDFFTEEGEKEKQANPNVDEARMKKLDKNISSTLEQIDNFQRMLNQLTPS